MRRIPRIAIPSFLLLSRHTHGHNDSPSSEDKERKRQRYDHRRVIIENSVNELLKNPELNIKELPDFIEKRLYKVTIQLTLDAIFNSICLVDGTELFGHHITLESQPIENFILPKPLKPFDRKPLHIFVSKLLSDTRVNVEWLPDSIEHRLYFNCLVLIFTVLQSFLETTKIDLLGHRIAINMSPDQINYEDLATQTLQRRIGISETIVDKLVDDLLARYSCDHSFTLLFIAVKKIFIFFLIVSSEVSTKPSMLSS